MTSALSAAALSAAALSAAALSAAALSAAALSAAALDLGRPGRDQIYGWGLLQYSPLRGC